MKLKSLLAVTLSCAMLLDTPLSFAETSVSDTSVGTETEPKSQPAEAGNTAGNEKRIAFYCLRTGEEFLHREELSVETELTEDFSAVTRGRPFYLTLGSKEAGQVFSGYEENIILEAKGFKIEPIADTIFEGYVYKLTPEQEGIHKIYAYLKEDTENPLAVKELTVMPAEEKDTVPAEQSEAGNQTFPAAASIQSAEAVQQTEISINYEEKALFVGERLQLTAQVSPAQEVVWESSDPSVAAVNESGLVTAVKAGSALITVKAGESRKTCTVTVKRPELSLNKTNITLYQGESAALKVMTDPQAAVQFTSANAQIAAVDHNGLIKGIKAGKTVITAAANGITAACAITVRGPELTIKRSKETVYLGYPVTLSVKAYPTAKIAYQSSNKKVATVNAKGKVTGKKAGKAVITVTGNGMKKKCTVTIKKPSIKLMEKNLIIYEKNTYKISAAACPKKTLKWKSANQKLASVNKAGIVTGVKAGKTKITISFGSTSKVCNVTVLKNKHKLNKSSLSLMKGAAGKLYMSDLDTNAFGYVTYSIEDGMEGDIVSLSIKNNVCTVKALRAGQATIHASYYNYFQGALVACTNKAVIKVTDKGIVQQRSAIAVKTKMQMTLKGVNKQEQSIQKTEWRSSDSKIAAVNKASGIVTGKSKGAVSITAKVYYGDQTTKEYSASVRVSNPSIKQKTKVITVHADSKLPLTGLTAYSNVVYKSSKKAVAFVTPDGRIITGGKTGKATITAQADGKKLSSQVYVTNPQLKESYKPLAVGEKSKIKVTGISGKSKVTYKTKNKKVAVVSKTGQIRATGRGSAQIVVTADGKKLNFEVNVGSKKAIQAIHKAVSIMYSSSYSQPRRMSPGYYDCSSLTYRAYQPNASALLGGGAWAPTAAAQAQYLAARGKVIAYGPIEVSKLQPGDLLFFSGSYNGRYKNIYHVSMYYGGGLRIEKPMRVYYPLDNIVMVARPTK